MRVEEIEARDIISWDISLMPDGDENEDTVDPDKDETPVERG